MTFVENDVSNQIFVIDALFESLSILTRDVVPTVSGQICDLYVTLTMEALKDAKLVPGLYRRTMRQV